MQARGQRVHSSHAVCVVVCRDRELGHKARQAKSPLEAVLESDNEQVVVFVNPSSSCRFFFEPDETGNRSLPETATL